MLNHRRRCHPRSRINNLDDFIDEKYEHDSTENIVKITDYRDGLYLAEIKDGLYMWKVLDDDDELVQDYKTRQETQNEIDIETVDDVNSWNKCPWIPDTIN